MLGAAFIYYGFFITEDGSKDLMDQFNQTRKNYVMPSALNSDKVLGTDLNYKQLSEYLAWGVGILYMLAGLSAVMAERT